MYNIYIYIYIHTYSLLYMKKVTVSEFAVHKQRVLAKN